ncbi:MAG: hypothetical protein DWQ49_12555 [Bacteroidetes bacterium]|nr:MAG: hypothetical protein DWQ49_12555 [Bacteroidota bacterium]
MNMNLLTKVTFMALTFGAIIFYWWFTDGPTDGLWFFSIFGLAIVLLMIGQHGIESFFENNLEKILKILRYIGILPQPTEAGLFVMAVATLVVPTVYGLWPSVYEFVKTADDPKAFLYMGMFLFGLYLSVQHMFIKRGKKEWETGLMRFFMIIFLIGLSVGTGIYVYAEKQSGYLILSAWSAIQAVVLFILANKRWSHKTIKMPTKESTKKEMIATIIIAPAVIILAWLLEQHWIVAFSSTLFVWSYFEIFITPNARVELTVFEKATQIWQNEVPKSGQASTVQGEMLRCIEKVRDEAQRNGNANRDGEHLKLLDYIETTLLDEYRLSEHDKIKEKIDFLRNPDNLWETDETDEPYDYLTEKIMEWHTFNPGENKRLHNPDIKR